MLIRLISRKIKGLIETPNIYRDWCKFNIVGVLGVVLQLVLLKCLVALGIGYIVATAIAVEITIIHNFFWHEHWTWKYRIGKKDRYYRLLGFNSTNGLISLLGNMLFMKIFVGTFHLPIILANLIAIILCATFNFFVSNQLVFRKKSTMTVLLK
jgi:dolichol-phosphate mannosyltransferase